MNTLQQPPPSAPNPTFPTPPRQGSAGSSNPWASRNPFAALAGSDAGSVRSVGSASRRAAAAAQAAADRERRRHAFEENEARLAQALEDQLKVADEESEAVKQAGSEARPTPLQSAVEAEEDVVRREIADLAARQALLQRILDGKASGFGEAGEEDEESDAGSEASPTSSGLASLNVKIKIVPPPLWKGEYDYVKREGWIKTVQGYLAAVGFDPQARLSESLTPHPFHVVRSLFSPELVNGFSALSWFDARQRREPFVSAQQVLDAVRAHWKDDHAAEAAVQAYRAARQGSSRARDYGSRLETLADACFDRTIGEDDRITTFVAGLNPNYREYLKTQVAMLKNLGRAPSFLQDYVDLAAVADGLESFASSLKKSSGGVISSSISPSPKKAVTFAGQPSSSPPAGTSVATTTWRGRAATWQAAHPISSRTDWFRESDRKSDKSMNCYNCGRLADHFSSSCPNERRDPKSVTIALVRAQLSGTLSPRSPSVSGSGNDGDSSDSESGKADGE
ncbi:hypothetical protein JCM5296_001320 [Sporobolomyces johnsonii]